MFPKIQSRQASGPRFGGTPQHGPWARRSYCIPCTGPRVLDEVWGLQSYAFYSATWSRLVSITSITQPTRLRTHKACPFLLCLVSNTHHFLPFSHSLMTFPAILVIDYLYSPLTPTSSSLIFIWLRLLSDFWHHCKIIFQCPSIWKRWTCWEISACASYWFTLL